MRSILAFVVTGFLLFGIPPWAWADDPVCQNRAWVDHMMHSPPEPYPVAMKIMTSPQLANFLKFGPSNAPASLSDPKAHVLAGAWLFKEKGGSVEVVFYIDGCVKNHVAVPLPVFLSAINGISTVEPGA